MVVIYFVLALLSAIVLFGYIIFNKKRKNWNLVLFSSVFVVNLGYSFLSVSNSVETALWANRLAYLGSVLLPLSMLMIILKVSKIRYKKWLPIALLFLCAIVFLIAGSPGFSDIYYKEVTLLKVNGATVLEKVYGPWHKIYLFYLLGYFAATVAVVLYSNVKKKIDSTVHAVLLNLAIFVNIGVWLFEQIVKIEFEILSVSYVVCELFILGLDIMVQEQQKLREIIAQKEEFINTQAQFKKNLKKLTETEQKVYALYIEGKTTKEVLEILDIKENTLKFHNKNIYDKLAVSSKKELIQIGRICEGE